MSRKGRRVKRGERVEDSSEREKGKQKGERRGENEEADRGRKRPVEIRGEIRTGNGKRSGNYSEEANCKRKKAEVEEERKRRIKCAGNKRKRETLGERETEEMRRGR